MEEKIPENETTRLHFAISESDVAYGIGCELYKKREDGDLDIYHIFSLYLLKSEIKSKRQVLYHALSIILPEVNPLDRQVILTSRIPHFAKCYELKRKIGQYLGGRKSIIVPSVRVRRHTVHLAYDALGRKNSIIEKL